MGIKTVQDTSLTSVANAIRVKAEISGTLEFPDDFVSAIQNISTGITPTGTLTITQNGTYDVTDYASADVQTPQPSGSISITQNGTVDVSQYASANVNVGGGGGSDDTLKLLISRKPVDLVIPNGTDKIGVNAFYNYKRLDSVTIPSSVTLIDEGAFYGCTGLKSVMIPNGVTSVNMDAFRGCSKLQSIDFPSSILVLGRNILNGCTSLTSVTFRMETPPTISAFVLDGIPATCPIYVPAASVEAYKAATYWSDRAAYIQAIPS